MLLRSCCLLPLSFVAFTSAGAVTAAEPAAKEVEVNGITMPYLDEGAGEPIVFVHGAVSDVRAWEPIRIEITDKYRFIAPTLRYFGVGEWSDKGEKFSVTTHADDVATFIRTLDVGPVHLVGWSYGAGVAAAAALAHPDLIQDLILFEPPLSSLIKDGEGRERSTRSNGKDVGAYYSGGGRG